MNKEKLGWKAYYAMNTYTDVDVHIDKVVSRLDEILGEDTFEKHFDLAVIICEHYKGTFDRDRLAEHLIAATDNLNVIKILNDINHISQCLTKAILFRAQAIL